MTKPEKDKNVCQNCGASLTAAGVPLLRCPICGTKVPSE